MPAGSTAPVRRTKDSQFVIVCGLVAAIGLSVAGRVTGCGNGYSEGTRTGTDASGSPSLVPNVWQFHASDAMAPKVEEAQRAGKPVSIHYRQWIVSPATQDADYDVVSVTVEP